MTDFRLDVLAIGDAVVDVISTTTDAFLEEEGLVKGSMRLIGPAEATRLYDRMGVARETSGGSAANTVAGIAALGGRAGFVGLVAKDQLGEIFAHDIRALGVEYQTPPSEIDTPTGRCLILVTPDAQRTMNTCPGVSHLLSPKNLDEGQIRGSAILYLEAYLWVPELPRTAMEAAIRIAHSAGARVALTLSDIACIARCRSSFSALLEAREIDILFANEKEVMAIADTGELGAAVAWAAERVSLLVVTCSEKGALAVDGGHHYSVPAALLGDVVDTTGAGDLFAAGFLAGHARGLPTEQCLRMGAIAAGEVISHFGARPEADLKALMTGRLT